MTFNNFFAALIILFSCVFLYFANLKGDMEQQEQEYNKAPKEEEWAKYYETIEVEKNQYHSF